MTTAGKLQSEPKKRQPFELIEQEVFLNLIRSADQLSRGVDEALKPAGLSATQYNVLRILRGAGAGDCQGLACQEIGERMVTRDPDITRLLDRIESRGLIARQRSTTDRRVVHTRITDAGLALLATLDAPLAAMHKEQFRCLTKAQIQTLIDLLERVRDATPET